MAAFLASDRASGACCPPAPTASRPPPATQGAADTEFRAFKLDVLRVEGGLIAEITAFDAALFPELGLPPTL